MGDIAGVEGRLEVPEDIEDRTEIMVPEDIGALTGISGIEEIEDLTGILGIGAIEDRIDIEVMADTEVLEGSFPDWLSAVS